MSGRCLVVWLTANRAGCYAAGQRKRYKKIAKHIWLDIYDPGVTFSYKLMHKNDLILKTILRHLF
jgi:hypothetical protein